ncbi:MAG: leucine-rich repeat domain-containing protein, partial [Duncaniella sp.]|nr:leucine-rich repeat domain-containing protein [Duncaniella sp.]
SVTTIGSGVFEGCDKLESVELPSSITNVEIPEDATEIGSGSFSGLTNITSVTIPESVTTIGAGAFEGCEKLEDVTIPAGVTTIEENAFAGSGLKEMTFDSTPETIAAGAFPEGVAKLSIKDPDEWCGVNAAEPILGTNGSLYVDGKKVDELTLNPEGKTVGSYAFANTDIEKASITADEIGEGAFSGSAIEKVCLNVSTIGKDAFAGCENLLHIYSLSEVPPVVDASSFPDTDFMWMYVPTGSAEAYKAAEPWNKYYIIEDTPENLKAYYDGTLEDPSTGIDEIQATGTQGEETFYNLSGIAVGNDLRSLQPGVYVGRSSNGIRKIVIR